MLILLFQYFSLNWQHQLCKNPRSNPDIKTLFTDHACGPTNGARPPPPTNNPLVGPIPKAGAFPPIGSHNVSNYMYKFVKKYYSSRKKCLTHLALQPFQPVVSPSPGAIAGWMSSTNPPLPHAAMAAGPPSLVQSSTAGGNFGNYLVLSLVCYTYRLQLSYGVW